jgi:predicted GNAT family acetyltransferase
MTTDKTGAATEVAAESDRFTIAVEGKTVGHADFVDRDQQRVFTHTEVDGDFEGRGLATMLIKDALQQTRDAGMRIVPVCKMVANYIEKHDEYADAVDPVSPDVERWLADR